MALLTESLLVDGVLALATLFSVFYYYMTSTYDYWAKRGVPYLKPTFPFGNLKDQILLKTNFFLAVKEFHENLAGHKFGGYFEFRRPVLMIRDPELIQQILIKDFSYFSDRDFGTLDLEQEPLSGSLFNLKGQLWRNLRNKLTPTFTSGKLKGMLEQLCNSGDFLVEDIKKLGKESVDAKKLSSSFSLDVIASCSFGLQFKPNSPEENQFREVMNKLLYPSKFRMLQTFLIIFTGKLAKLLNFRQIPKDLSDYVIRLVKSTMEFRKKNNIQRNDFLQLMMNLKTLEESGKQINFKNELTEEDAYLNQMEYSKDELENSKKVFSDECIAAQSLVFLTGGSEAISNSLSYALFELASNPSVQTKLQRDIDEVLSKHNGQITYEALREMSYLDMFVQERNRMHSEGGLLQRICNTPYKIPGTDVVIEKGIRVVVSLFGVHKDPEYYSDPEKFIPERFEGNNHRSSGTYLPFGDGPRTCIAMRFVLLELKVAIVKIMSKYSVTLDPRTQVPLRFPATSFVFQPIGGIWVRFQPRIGNQL